jgi:peroxiredoxin
MVAVHSTMLPLGTAAPGFTLPDGTGRIWTLDEIADGAPALVVSFLSNHCPYVKRIGEGFGRATAPLAERGVAVVGIMSNDVEGYPDDAPDRMVEAAAAWGWTFPYLYDETQEVAIAYRAACTPDTFVFDGQRRLAYRGQIDAARPSNDVEVTAVDLLAAVDAVLAGGTPSERQVPSMGCNIKWRPGNAPDWFA